MIFIMFLMALGVIGLVMMFLLSGADWKTFGALINHDVVGIVYGLLWGVVSIAAWIGFSKKRGLGKKSIHRGMCGISGRNFFQCYHYAQGIKSGCDEKRK